MPISRPMMAGNDWCATGICPSVRLRLALARLRCASRVCAIGWPALVLASAFGSPRPCRPMRAGRRAWRCLILYLKGISTGDFEDVLAALVGKDAPGLSASTIGRLKEAWIEEHVQWGQRDLSAKRYVYFWADGIHLEARLEDQAQCILVIIGATPGRQEEELVGFTDGVRESAQSWRELLDLGRRGLSVAPELAVADGGARLLEGAWRSVADDAASSAAGSTRPPTSSTSCPRACTPRPNARCSRSGWPRPRTTRCSRSMSSSAPTAQYEKAAECLTKDRDALLAFYDFPAEHWTHLRTTNPIESTFATVRHRTIRSKNCLSNKTALAMVFKLIEAAQKSWRRLRGYNQLPKVVQGVKFSDGIEVVRPQPQAAA